MRSFPELYVLRHGETVWNVEGRLQGGLDSALTARGRAQAARQGEILASLELYGFSGICSPQGRAAETARIALPEVLKLSYDPALREIGMGDWAGKARADLGDVGKGFDLYEAAPGGEGFTALARRCAAFLEGVQGPAVLVTHGITSRMIRTLATGQPIEMVREIGGGQGCVYHVAGGVQKRID
ncbi:histidine phosphatase family protein [Sulfitobacter albidus]|uniref:Histidine phosphatase family protein n=1 Tax=Sulfitobacter albidus TaxID=2829501 RepID=A0A975JFC4_9RHOB|nr:histidine phosphatase family protein [Sulfitobacter albidus]QUJ77484.1 histidine phosphatase family protein [Sulfitobacter albidus]